MRALVIHDLGGEARFRVVAQGRARAHLCRELRALRRRRAPRTSGSYGDGAVMRRLCLRDVVGIGESSRREHPSRGSSGTSRSFRQGHCLFAHRHRTSGRIQTPSLLRRTSPIIQRSRKHRLISAAKMRAGYPARRSLARKSRRRASVRPAARARVSEQKLVSDCWPRAPFVAAPPKGVSMEARVRIVHWYDTEHHRVACGAANQSNSTKHVRGVTCPACLALVADSVSATHRDGDDVSPVQ